MKNKSLVHLAACLCILSLFKMPISFSEPSALVNHKPGRGAGLERLTKGMDSKLKIQIPEGMKHPEQPL